MATAEHGRRVFGRYRIVERLGRGGMGEVYRAVDESRGVEVALKCFAGRTDGERLKFRREFHTLAGLKHPRIVEVYDFGIDRGEPYYTMELLDGQDLRDIAPVGPREACRLLRDVGSALAFLHSKRLLHRDIAPRNVRCTSDGRAKLLDFGLLATIGAADDIVGTLPCMAPEMFLGAALDQRSDLFGLGALSYWLLTGRHARPFKSVREVRASPDFRPAAPSSVNPKVPAALDNLVLGLLSPDPLGRPASAAEVIDRLGGIGALEPAPELEVARGYVESVALVGRDREMDMLRRRMQRALEGRGRAIVVRGRSGSGKSRLLAEAKLEAKLAGLNVFEARGGGISPYALAADIMRQIVAAAPEAALRATKRRPDLLGTVMASALSPLGLKSTEPTEFDPTRDGRERRLRVQSEVLAWFVDVSHELPLAILVDNLERADEASVALLASLAREARARRILVLCSLRSDATPLAREAVDWLREQSLPLRSRRLTLDQVRVLVRQMFGDVPNIDRPAAFMHRVSGGVPLFCVELARNLVERGVIRYSEGLFIIPEDLKEAAPPRGLVDVMDSRVRGLSERARSLGQVLAVCGGELSLDLIVAVSGTNEPDAVFASLDELLSSDALVSVDDRYRFRHETLREALLRSIPDQRRQELELKVGHELACGGLQDPELEARVGWHLLRGGDASRGAELLAAAGRRLFEATSFVDAIRPLEAAVDVYARDGGHRKDRAEMLVMLVTAGFYADREVVLRHSEAAFELVERHSGVQRARRLRVLGPVLALFIGVSVAVVLHWLSLPARRGPRPVEAMKMYFAMASYVAGTAAFSFDTEALRKIQEKLDPVTPIRSPLAVNTVRFIRNLLNFNLGQIKALIDSTTAGIRMAEANWHFADRERPVAIGGARFQRGLVVLRYSSEATLTEIEALEALGTRIWSVAALQLRAVHHTWRGEETTARQIRARVEAEFSKLGAMWQLDASFVPALINGYGFLEDVLGLKWGIEGCRRLVAAGLRYEVFLEIARGEYHWLRGDYELATTIGERALAFMPVGSGLCRAWALWSLCEAWFERGDLEQAKSYALEGSREGANPERIHTPFHCRCERLLALIEAREGHFDAANERLDNALQTAVAVSNPALDGFLREARAMIAFESGDRERFEHELARVDECFRPTGNPVLIARYDKLARLAGDRARRTVAR